METDGPDAIRETSSVRLTWAPPTPRARPRPKGDPIPGPPPKHTVKTPKSMRPAGVPEPAAPSEPEPAPGPPAATDEPAPSPATVAVPPREPEPHLGRAFAEAFDRLSDRLLERLRSLRQDVDGDLASVRAELAGLRQAVDAVGDRVQVRQIRTTLDEVNAEVIALRRAVLEWPELEQVALDVGAIRSDMAWLFSMSGGEGPGQAPSELLGELQHLVANLAGEVRRLGGTTPAGGDSALLLEVASIREELSALRRRPLAPAGRLDDDQLDWLAAAVAERVADQLAGRERAPDRRAERDSGFEDDRRFEWEADPAEEPGRRRRRR